jgi:tRNA (guanine37-N1)-methyltransferase
MVKSSCLRTPKKLGEKALSLAKELGLLNRELKIQQRDDNLYIPLLKEQHNKLGDRFKRALSEYEIVTYEFPKRKKLSTKPDEALKNVLPPHLRAHTPSSIDFVGEIAIVEIPSELEEYKKVIGDAILANYKKVSTVLSKAGAVKGVYRVREYENLAGADKTETVHREYGCTYHLDLSKVYFSPRLSHEHNRVASQVKEGETVIDMFSGVGPFAILIAKKTRSARIYAIDANPTAIKYLKRNVEINHVQDRVTPILGDAEQVVHETLTGVAHRVIMNLPEKAIEYLGTSFEALRPEGGIIHYYEFVNEPKPVEATKKRLMNAVKGSEHVLKRFLSLRIVREVAPFTWQVAADVEIQ